MNLQFYFGLFLILIESFNLTLSKDDLKVIEVDDRIIEFSNQGKWLITFYAPWCGHCRKLEPVIEEVAKYFDSKSSITIVKIDATKFVKAANHFEIKAYPTIKYINGKTILNYSGERRKEDIVDFLAKVDSPRVSKTLNKFDFENILNEHKHFFLYIGSSQDEILSKQFYDLANRYFLDAYFFNAHPDHVVNIESLANVTQKVCVVKESDFFFFDDKKHSLEEFVKNERFPTFTEVTISNFHNLIETRKTLLILDFDPEDKLKEKQTKKLRHRFNLFSKSNRPTYHNEFHFGYVQNSDILNGIAIWTLSPPVLFILNTTSLQYSLINLIDSKNELVDLNIGKVLDDVRQNKIEFFGGQSFFRTLRRPLWELYRAIIEMFYEAPFLSLLIFGFPFAVISIVCYFLCCVDSSDQSDMEEFSDSEIEEELEQEQENYLDESNTQKQIENESTEPNNKNKAQNYEKLVFKPLNVKKTQ